MPVSPSDLVAAPGWAREQLAGRYGHIAHDVLAMGHVERIVDGRPDLLAEVAYAARREQARTVGDVLLRRTRLGLTAARAAARPAMPSSASRRCSAPSWSGTKRAARGRFRPSATRLATKASCPRVPHVGPAGVELTQRPQGDARNFRPLRRLDRSEPLDLEPLCHAVSSSR